MIELDRHIEILLLSNDCVIVPGLGGFMTHHVQARYDTDDQMFLPPLRTLGFNPQLTMNDSLLVQSYIEAYDISYPEALRRIESEVEELKQHIDAAGYYELNDIGELSLNEEGKYLFTPCEAGILTPELYGLSSFEMKPITTGIAVAEEKKETVTEKTVVPVLGGLTTDKVDDDERAIVIKMSWIRNTVAIAAAILAFFLMTTPVSNSDSTQINMGNLSNPLLVSTHKPAVKTDTTIKITPDTTIADKTVAEVKKDSVVAQPETIKTGYCLVLASHVSKKNAQAFVEELHKRGFTEAEIFIRNNVTRVIYGHFETMNAAYNRLNRVRDNKGFEEAWVLKLKDKV
ncbi:MAG: SPOR domain-containing protein [Prevotella sp.]|nr:SPOR domain-containing protein [Prevotella sp.]